MRSTSNLNYKELFTIIQFADFESKFPNRTEIGKGSGSVVYKSTMEGTEVAIKIYNNVQLQPQNQKDVIREIEIHKYLRENYPDYFLAFYGAYAIKKVGFGADYCIVMSYCRQSLDQYLKSTELTQEDKFRICIQISQELSCLHRDMIIHRDLKAQNILIAEVDGRRKPMIADFGHSKLIEQGIQMTTMRGTMKYANPELLYESEYGLEWDIFSLGILILQIISGQYLFNIPLDINSHAKFHRKFTEELDHLREILGRHNVSSELKGLVWECLRNKEYTITHVIRDLQGILGNLERRKRREAREEEARKEEARKEEAKKEEVKANPELEKTPNFQKNKNTSSQISQAQPESKAKVERASTIDSCLNSSNKQKEPEAEFESQENTATFQMLEEPQNLPRSTIESGLEESEAQKSNRRFSEIVESQVEGRMAEEQMLYSFANDSSEEGTTNSERIRYSRVEKLRKAQSFRHIPQFSEERVIEESSPGMMLPQALKTKEKLQSRLLLQAEAFADLQRLKKYEKKMLSFRQIEAENISQKDKKKLILMGFMWIICKTEAYRQSKSGNIYSVKYIDSFLNKLRAIEKELKARFLNTHGKGELNSSMEVLKAYQPTLEQITNELNRSIERVDSPGTICKLRALFK